MAYRYGTGIAILPILMLPLKDTRGKRDLLAHFICRTGLIRGAELNPLNRARLTVLAYHRVLNIDEPSYPFDENTVSASLDEFDWQMRYIKTHYDVLSFAELLTALADRHPPPRPLIVTFDDGYRDNYTHAYPILRLHDLPATVFLASGYIGKNEPFWFEKVAYWMKSGSLQRFRFGMGPTVELPLGTQRLQSLRTVMNTLYLANEREHARLMGQLEEQFPVSPRDRHLVATLSWDDVREMHQAKIEFGAHSVSHLNLARLSKARLRRELEDSKSTIEREIGSRVLALAYPIGRSFAYNERVKAVARQTQYSFAVTYDSGVNRLRALDRYGIRRVRIERCVSSHMFRAMVNIPRFFLQYP